MVLAGWFVGAGVLAIMAILCGLMPSIVVIAPALAALVMPVVTIFGVSQVEKWTSVCARSVGLVRMTNAVCAAESAGM